MLVKTSMRESSKNGTSEKISRARNGNTFFARNGSGTKTTRRLESSFTMFKFRRRDSRRKKVDILCQIWTESSLRVCAVLEL